MAFGFTKDLKRILDNIAQSSKRRKRTLDDLDDKIDALDSKIDALERRVDALEP